MFRPEVLLSILFFGLPYEKPVYPLNMLSSNNGTSISFSDAPGTLTDGYLFFKK